MEKKQKKILSNIWVSCILVVVIICVGSVIRYMRQPEYQLDQYIGAMNNRDYNKACGMYFKEKLVNQFSEQELLSFITKYGQDIGLVKIVKGRINYKNDEKAFYEIVYHTNQGDIKQVLGMVRSEGKWQVIFPFKIQNLSIQAPEGAMSYVNGRQIEEEVNGERNVKVLPGEYIVRIIYPNNLHEDYVTKVKVPKQLEVRSPYTTVPVEVIAPKGTIVELAGIQKENNTGKVVFDKVLEGNYDLSIFDKSGYFEPLVQKLNVVMHMPPVEVNHLMLSPLGAMKFKEFINHFYDVYLDCIRAGDVVFLESYLNGEQKETIETEFKRWFIDYKEIKKADLTIELNELSVNADGGITANILEVVTMTNRETSDGNQGGEKQYQVMLRWTADFGLEEQGFVLKHRTIIESIVAQKDTDGEWVQY